MERNIDDIFDGVDEGLKDFIFEVEDPRDPLESLGGYVLESLNSMIDEENEYEDMVENIVLYEMQGYDMTLSDF